jgi:hypothetical protein
MTPGLLLALTLLSAAAPAPLRLAMPGFNTVNVPAAEAQLHQEFLAEQLSSRGLRVLTARDIAAVVGVERQRQLLGCQESGCSFEIAGALGADGVITGDLGLLEGAYVWTVKVLAAQDGTVLASRSARSSSARALRDGLQQAAADLTRQLSTRLGRKDLDAGGAVDAGREGALGGAAPGGGLRGLAWAPATLGAVLLGAGGVLQWQAAGRHTALQGAGSLADAARLRDEGGGLQTGAAVAAGAGVLALGTAAVFLFTGGPQPSVAVLPGGGAMLGLTGVLP